MAKLQRVISYLYFCLMVFGALFALLCVGAGVKHIGENAGAGREWWRHPALSNTGIGIIFLLLTVAFAIVFLKRGSHSFAPFTYVASYLVTGYVLLPVLFGLEKGGASFTMENVPAGIALGIAGGIAVVTAGLIWNYKKALRVYDA